VEQCQTPTQITSWDMEGITQRVLLETILL